MFPFVRGENLSLRFIFPLEVAVVSGYSEHAGRKSHSSQSAAAA